MLRRLSFFGAIALVATGVVLACNEGLAPAWFNPPPDDVVEASRPTLARVADAPPVTPGPAQPAPSGSWPRVVAVAPRAVIPGARLSPIRSPRVSSLRDGELLFLATPVHVKADEHPPPGAFQYAMPYLVTEVEAEADAGKPHPDWVKMDGKWYRPLEQGDEARPNKVRLYRRPTWFLPVDEGTRVQERQVLGLIDPRTAVDALSSKLAKLDADEADRLAAERTRDEARERWMRADTLWHKGAGSMEDATGAKLTWERYIYETTSKTEAVKVAATELREAETALEQHVIRSKVNGQVRQVLRHQGEAVKNLDPVLEESDYSRLRVIGRAAPQDLDALQEPGSVLALETTRLAAPQWVLTGHMGEVTGVAVSRDNQVVSVSDDRTVRVWEKDLSRRAECRKLDQPAAVRAVACTAKGAAKDLALTGSADGVARLYDLAAPGDPLVREFRDANGHRRAIHSVAFAPDGRWAVTGGDDRALCLWEVDSGRLLQRFPADVGHRGGVTSVAFLPAGPGNRLSVVSAGRDNALLVWPLAADGAPGHPVRPPGWRGGEVTALGVNPHGGQLLFDQDRELRLLSAENGALVGSLSAPSGTTFRGPALFSPDGRLVLASAGDRPGLWRAPTAATRGHELQQLVGTPGHDEQAPVRCAAFAPDGSFLVTGGPDRHVIVWPMPSKEAVERRLTAKVIAFDPEVNSGQVRVTAELNNPGDLLPGDAVTLVVYPAR
jgi:WD40 repeat protein